MNKKKFYLTSAIVYTNQNPHIGFALELLYADVLARYHRAEGEDVWFLTGTDEHGQKIAKVAKAHNMDSQKWTNAIAGRVKELTRAWNISNDDFIRTTETRHERGAQKFWTAAAKRGDIYKKTYSALYCEGCEAFKTAKDLDAEGKCPDHKIAPAIVEEENYFFKLSAYQKKLEALFRKNKKFVVPETKRNEMREVLKGGLDDISISRSRKNLTWGVPVPSDKEQVMYVWFDALTNYVTALGYATNAAKFKRFWPADAHIIGKEINRFHSLLWPAMLMSAGLKVPKQIAVHGWITVDGQKMSKTLGNVIDPFDLAQKYPLDAIRYFFMREIPFDNDGDFSFERFQNRYSADLANDLGNLLMRVITLSAKGGYGTYGSLRYTTMAHPKRMKKVWLAYKKAMQNFAFHAALDIVWKYIATANKRLTDEKPWENLASKKSEKCVGEILAELFHVAYLIAPFMPETSEKMLKQIKTLKAAPLFPRL